ncbi:MAG: hypothetical protein ABWZ88_06065 [Variovorax sp.]
MKHPHQQTRRTPWRWALPLAAVLVLAACGGGGGDGGSYFPIATSPPATTPPPGDTAPPPVVLSPYDSFVAYVKALVQTALDTSEPADVAAFDPPPVSDVLEPVATP